MTALDEGKENVGPEASTETIGKQSLGANKSELSQGLLFQKKVADKLLGNNLL